jgi:inner membrane protein
VDPLTHGLASFAVTRTFFPRISRAVLVGAIAAGTIADVDLVSSWIGPSAFLQWHRTLTHSLAGTAIIVSILSLLLVVMGRRDTTNKVSLRLCVLPVLCCALLHLAMDLCQSDGMALLWPFRAQRFSADWIAHVDLWILAILLGGVLLPRLFGLVTTEIGAKSRGPKGQVGAAICLVVVFMYVGTRGMLHATAVAELRSRAYRGESPLRWAAFPESASPFHWHGIVETERMLHDVPVDVTSGASFDPDAALTIYKPEPSAALDAATNTEAARRFLQVARFPKASVEKTVTGFRVEIRAFPYRAPSISGWRVMALIEIDAKATVRDQELVWNPASKVNWISDNLVNQSLTTSRRIH